jgi:hypothetical protein
MLERLKAIEVNNLNPSWRHPVDGTPYNLRACAPMAVADFDNNLSSDNVS